MKKICITILKISGTLTALLVLSVISCLIAAPLVNDHVARETAKELKDLPLPSNTEYVESLSKADKLVGCGNGMQYLGAILIQSELSLEELEAYYSGYAEHDWECIVERQASAEIEWVEYERKLAFQTDVEGDDYYIVYSWGSNDTIFDLLDVRGH